MAFRIKVKRYAARNCGPGTDNVIYWCPVPVDGIWLGATIDLHVISATAIDPEKAIVYGISGYFIPVRDPTALPTNPDLFFDTQVTKDTAIAEDALDLSDASNTTEDIKPGVPNLALMTDSHTGPVRLFRTERLMTFASGGRTMVTTAGSETYLPIDRLRLTTKKQVRARKTPGVVLIAISRTNEPIPDAFPNDAVSGWAPGQAEGGVTVAEREWRMLKHMQRWMEDASMFLVPGGVETGAHEPYEAAAELAGRMVEQAMEDSASDWDIASTLFTFAIGTGSIVVPGRPRMKMLKGN